MAFVVGDIVTIARQATTAGGYGVGSSTTNRVQMQPPLFGVVHTAATPVYTVLWDNGALVAAITATTTLRKLVDADASEITRLYGKVVNRVPAGQDDSDSAAYAGLVVMMYKLQTEAAVNGVNLALIRTQEGLWMEVVASDLQPQAGQ